LPAISYAIAALAAREFLPGNMMLWKHIRHFNRAEKWGDPNKINGFLLLTMDALRDIWQSPFVIHCAYDLSGHSANSQHYLGNACDFHIEDGEPFNLQVAVMARFLEKFQVADRVGLGIYPDWRNPGFHLDVRGQKARWGRINNKYVSFLEAKTYARIKGGY
jgi:hypothetical protein